MSTITLLTSAGAVRVEGENLVIDIRDIPETPATSSQPVTAPGRMTSSPSVRDTHSAPSKAETGRAGGPVCVAGTHQENSLEREPETGTAIFPAAVSSIVGARQAADPTTSDCSIVRAPKSSDLSDPGPIPSFMDRRAKKELAA